jgi:hypothetical protein
MKGTKNKIGRKDLKLKRDTPPKGSLRENIQQGAGSSSVPLRGPVETSEPAVELSVEGRRNQWLKTCLRHNQNLLSWESVVLTYHCRELALPANLQQEEEWDTYPLE